MSQQAASSSAVPITISANSDLFTAPGGGSISVAMYAQFVSGGQWNYFDSSGGYTPVPAGGPIPAFATLTSDSLQTTVQLPDTYVQSGAFIFGINGLPDLVAAGTTAPSEPGQPATVGLIYDAVEFSYTENTGSGGGGVLTINTTAVNQFGMPIVLQMTPNAVVLPNGAGVTLDRADTFTQFASFVAGTPFAQCAQDMFNVPLTLGILAPQFALSELCVQGVTANPVPNTSWPSSGPYYYYAITALNGDSSPAESVPQSNIVAVDPGGQQVTVSWSPNASQTEPSSIASYNVYRGTPSGSTVSWSLLGNQPASAFGPGVGGAFTDPGAPPDNSTAPPANSLNFFFDQEIQTFFQSYQSGNTITLNATDGTNDGYVYTFQGTTLPATGTPEMLQFTLQSVANLGSGTSQIPLGTAFNIYSPYWCTNWPDASLPEPPSWMPAAYPTTLTASAMAFGATGVFADGVAYQQEDNLPSGVDPEAAPLYGTLLASLENQIVSALIRGIASSIAPQNWANAPTQQQPAPAALPPGQSTGLEPGTYFYVVTAVNTSSGTEESIASLEFSATPTQPLPCIEVSWLPLDASVASSFNVYRGTASQQENTVLSVPNGTPPVTSYVDWGAAGTTQFPPMYYPTGGTWSQYAAFFHQPSVSINGAAYASPYDDQGDNSSTLSGVNPTAVTITLGPWSS